MKISGVTIENVGGVRDLELLPTKPVVLIAGDNGAGKTTVLEAIRMALTGETDRVQFKNQYGQLVTDGADDGYIKVLIDNSNYPYSILLPSGDLVPMTGDSSIPFLLDMQRFSHSDANTCRTLLATITNTTPTADRLSAKMLDRGCDKNLTERIGVVLVGGIESALKHAKNMATEAKGAWRSVTGETYGSQKADTWRMASPTVAVSIVHDEKKARALVAELDQSLANNQNQIVLLHASLEEAIHHNSKIEVYAKKASPESLERLDRKLGADVAEFERINQLIEQGKGKQFSCPCCNELVVSRGDELVKADNFVPMSAEKLQTYEQSLSMLKNAINNDKRDINEALTAQSMLKELGVSKDIELIKSNENAIKARIQAIKAERDTAKNNADKLKNDMQVLAEATQKTKQAAAYHHEIVEWSKIADALSPDGIPSEMLGEALARFNERLSQSSMDSLWLTVSVSNDMAITYGGRAYSLLSESEKWRADAMITEAISFISENKLFALDRMDVLDVKSRGNCLAWLETLADNDEIDTVFVAATLKQQPAESDVMQVVWLGNQTQLSVQEAA